MKNLPEIKLEDLNEVSSIKSMQDEKTDLLPQSNQLPKNFLTRKFESQHNAIL